MAYTLIGIYIHWILHLDGSYPSQILRIKPVIGDDDLTIIKSKYPMLAIKTWLVIEEFKVEV